MNKIKLIGPFRQLLTMNGLPAKGPLSDDRLEIIEHAGILVSGDLVEVVGSFMELKSLTRTVETVDAESVAMPGLIDAHTHLCWAGSRAGDYAMRTTGKSYLEIAQKGGGIWSTVTSTREAGQEELASLILKRAGRLLRMGTTTIEVKSGYGLNTADELKMLKSIRQATGKTAADLVPTCLAAHIKPKDFKGTAKEYLDYIIRELLPEIQAQKLASRVDIYIDRDAFSAEDGLYYLSAAKKLGFDIAVHADQFFPGGLQVAVELGAVSADHLEATSEEEIQLLAGSKVIPVALPGASIGLGTGFAPARKLLDAGASLAVASDWNPGSAPMGNLLMQAAVLGIYEKLSMAETFAAVTFRASAALRLNDRGVLKPGMMADIIAFPCSDYREILYNQGSMMPEGIWKKGKKVDSINTIT